MSKRKSFPLRISPALYDDLRRWADAEMRSVNAQIEYILQEAVLRKFGRDGSSNATTTARGTVEDHRETPPTTFDRE